LNWDGAIIELSVKGSATTFLFCKVGSYSHS
jgi:hypothetical protein